MKVKTSITLSEALLDLIDKRARSFNTNRSDFIEIAVSAFIQRQSREEQDAKDLEVINRRADYQRRGRGRSRLSSRSMKRGESTVLRNPPGKIQKGSECLLS